MSRCWPRRSGRPRSRSHRSASRTRCSRAAGWLIDRDTNEEIREALAGSADPAGDGGDPGLAALIDDLSLEGSEELDGVEVDRVGGSIDVDGLIERIRPIAEQPGAEDSEVIPGVGELNQLEDTLVGADFELFAAKATARSSAST